MAIDTRPVVASKAQATRDALVLEVSGKRYRIPWRDCSSALAGATAVQRSHFELAPSGYGIHWPLLDEDLAIGPLVGGAAEV